MTSNTEKPPSMIVDSLAIRKSLVEAKSHGDTEERTQERRVTPYDPSNSNKCFKCLTREKKAEDNLDGFPSPHEDNNELAMYKATTAYKEGPAQYFTFPWAECGDLDTFWRHDRRELDRYLVRWAIDQMTEITGDVMKVHDVRARHGRPGDVKPYNILHIVKTADPLGPGSLRVADVGLAKVHHQYTKYRDPAATRLSAERYEPPEMMSYIRRDAAIPRVYDCWRLGCLSLEFTVWLVNGQAKLRDFHRSLKNSDGQRFYEIKGGVYSRHHVVNGLITDMEAKLSDDTALGHLLHLASNHLLVPLEKRVDTETLYQELVGIRDQCEHRPSYCFDSYLTRLTRDGPSSNELTETDPRQPSNQNNDVDNPWLNIPDSEWARFLISGLGFSSLCPTMDTGLCDACSSIHFLTDDVDLGRTLQDLEDGSLSCRMCSFLFQCFSTVATGINGQRQHFLSQSRISSPLISFYVDPGYKGPCPRQAQLGLPFLPQSGGPQEFALLRDWVTLCDLNHDCVSGEFVGQMPTRLIDVGTEDTPSLRLVKTADEGIVGNYIALSHCWGRLPKDQRFCTYTHNIHDLKQHIPFDKLPQTFKDAVTATRELKARYVWIDSLCIIQEDIQDWKIEAGRMEDVFNSAYLTIAATSSTSSLDGFIKRKRERATIGVSTVNGPLYLAEAIDDFRQDVEQSILNTRGWVFQERLLSRRTIHFTSTQIYWECGNGVHCETMAYSRTRESDVLDDAGLPSYGLLKFKDDRMTLIESIYQTYSALNLSNITDRSKAILGLQTRLSRTFQSRAEYGIIWMYFERLLLWQRDQDLPLDEIPYREDEKVPTWSWMSLMGRISYLDVPFSKVNWTGDIEDPFSSRDKVSSGGRLQAKAHGLSTNEEEVKKRIVTDLTHIEFNPEDFRCVVVGTNTLPNEDRTIDQYVLLIRQMSPGLFKRIGAGTLLDTHIKPATEPVCII